MKSIRYSKNLVRYNDKYLFYSPELSVFKESHDLDNGYRSLQQAIDERHEALKKFEICLQDHKESFLTRNSNFIKRTIASSLVVLICFTLMSFSISYLGGQAIAHNISRLDRKVRETLNPTQEKQEKRIKRFQKTVEKSRPYYKALQDFIGSISQ